VLREHNDGAAIALRALGRQRAPYRNFMSCPAIDATSPPRRFLAVTEVFPLAPLETSLPSGPDECRRDAKRLPPLILGCFAATIWTEPLRTPILLACSGLSN